MVNAQNHGNHSVLRSVRDLAHVRSVSLISSFPSKPEQFSLWQRAVGFYQKTSSAWRSQGRRARGEDTSKLYLSFLVRNRLQAASSRQVKSSRVRAGGGGNRRRRRFYRGRLYHRRSQAEHSAVKKTHHHSFRASSNRYSIFKNSNKPITISKSTAAGQDKLVRTANAHMTMCAKPYPSQARSGHRAISTRTSIHNPITQSSRAF